LKIAELRRRGRFVPEWGVPRRSSKGTAHDFTVTARRVVEQAIGEKLDGSPLPNPNKDKNPAAVVLGRLGGAKGGAARAKALSKAERIAIAKKAARSRWAKGSRPSKRRD
jgi:hypothetical protein